jgi:hypothetical protein
MKAASSNASGDQPAPREKGSAERHPLQPYRGQVFLGVVAILAIGVATTLALLLLQLITARP